MTYAVTISGNNISFSMAAVEYSVSLSQSGLQGTPGKGIASSAYNESTGILTITYTDATTETLDLSGTFTARDAAIAAQAAAEAAQTAAETAETNAETAETNAAASASAASTSATNAAASETAAAASETAAAASESTAATSETNAATSASAASTSATAAATSATNAATSETNAAASASAASTSETNAAASETAAAASETAAGASETAASASASAASTSEANAAASATAAAASATTATQDLAALAASVADSEAARDASQAARDTTLGYRNEAEVHKTDAAQSATVATAAAAALVGTEGIIPTASEVLWLASKPQAGVNALGFFDTGARLLSGVSERAILRYGEDNDTLNYMLLDGGVDGVRLDFTAAGALFSDAVGSAAAMPGSSVGLVLDQSEGLVLGPELNADFNFDNPAAWSTTDPSITVSGGAANFVATPPTKYVFLSRSVGAGKRQLVTVVVSELTAGVLTLDVNGVTATIASAGTYQFRLGPTTIGGTVGIFSSGASTTATVESFSVRDIPGTHAAQPNAALQGKFGKAPKVVRNRLIQTENLTHVSWGKSNAGITVTDLGSGVFEIDFGASDRSIGQINLTPTDTNAYTAHVQMKGVAGETIRLSSKTNPTVEPVVKTLSADWQDFAITQSNSGSGRFLLDTFGGVTARVIQVRFPMQEAGSTATPYQRVGASNLDVTESGVESFGFYRPDLSDDVLPLTVPAIDGDILISGKNGTWIEPAAPSAGAFNIGPTAFTGGTPNILRVVGDITGVELIDKTLSASERERLIRYYQSRGAKGLLVPGPELVTNGGFDSDVSGWTPRNGNTQITLSANRARVEAGSNDVAYMWQQVTAPANAVILASVGFEDVLGGARVFAGIGSGTSTYYASAVLSGSDTLPFIFVASSANPVISLYASTSAVLGHASIFDNISVRELRPEEDW